MLCKKPLIIPIPGSRKTERRKENIGSSGILLTEQKIAAVTKYPCKRICLVRCPRK
ncbi:MAG: hypothetical protein K2P73_05250 [Lachnospiraceae bacterium]|nr:hypothetical protein [Lachnospiraceae bacterium]